MASAYLPPPRIHSKHTACSEASLKAGLSRCAQSGCCCGAWPCFVGATGAPWEGCPASFEALTHAGLHGTGVRSAGAGLGAGGGPGAAAWRGRVDGHCAWKAARQPLPQHLHMQVSSTRLECAQQRWPVPRWTTWCCCTAWTSRRACTWRRPGTWRACRRLCRACRNGARRPCGRGVS